MPTLVQKTAIGFAAIAALSLGSVAEAAVVDFNAQPTVYFVPSVQESGYTFTSISDGLGTNIDSLWPSNGTTHLMSWTNNGSTSGFSISADNGSVFSISTFAFGSGYINQYSPVTQLIVSGTGGNGSFSQTFVSGVDFNDYGPGLTQISLASGHTATTYTFTAIGSNNRAQFDNISISAVPEPESFAMLLAGLGLVTAAVKRRKPA